MTSPGIQTLLTKARKKREAGDFKAALELAEKAKALDPGDSAPYLIVGQCQRALGDHKKAVETFEFLTGHFPEEADLNAELGLAKWSLGEKEQGYQLAKKAVDLDPKSQFSNEILGLLAGEYECWPKAIEAYEVLVKIRPDHPAYYYQLCQAYNVSYR